VLPRFARLLAGSDQVLVFLDDASLASRRAESLTLATLGRFSASLAHEIRNPLAAISYATQLLEESRDIPEADRRLLEIIYQQTHRMNGIVENVLGLARREAARPEHVDLGEFVRSFVAEYRESHPLENDQLEAHLPRTAVAAMVDRANCSRSLPCWCTTHWCTAAYPASPRGSACTPTSTPAARPCSMSPTAAPAFRKRSPRSCSGRSSRPPGHGTGLGLYIARELCQANQASLDYVAVPAGGACFRIRLAGARAIATT
jgi:two-component system sensor histidine kinase PilS (NtrC family)